MPEHDAVDAGQSAVREGQREGLGLPQGDALAGKATDVHPRPARADGDGGAAILGHRDRKILLGAEHAGSAGGEVGRCVLGIVGDAAQRVGDNAG